jgi:hypothetical protein
MSPEIYNALVASVEKWKRNAEGLASQATIFSKDCPLCVIFLESKGSCRGCPVEQAGFDGCLNSPWKQAFIAWKLNDDEAWPAAARAEVEFLVSLIPPEGPSE